MIIDFFSDKFTPNIAFTYSNLFNTFKSKYGRKVYSKKFMLVSCNNSNTEKPNVNNIITIPEVSEGDFMIVDNIIIIIEININECE